MRPFHLASALLTTLAVSPPIKAQEPTESAKTRLDQVEVTATPLRQSAEELNQPVAVLYGESLEDARANTLGDTLDGMPGVQSGSFGPGASRPVIRGLDGARVQTLSGGLSSLDVSTVSADHAVSIDPFLADQIEVLKGPATLLYGTGAVGGAVNVVDGRIPEQLPAEPGVWSGRAALQGGDASGERAGLLRLDGGGEQFAFHFDATHRDTDDVEIPGFAESAALLAAEGEEPDPDTRGMLENSATQTRSLGFGASWIVDRGMLGIGYAEFDTLYGVPGHAHHEESEDAHDDEGDEHEEHGEEGAVRIDLAQRRWDLKSSLAEPLPGHEVLSFKMAHTDYQHVELEGDEVGTRFDNDASEARIEAVHHEWKGWQGAWGAQFGRRSFAAMGEEAFVPPSLSRDLGVFLIEKRALSDLWSLDLGARVDRVEVDPEGTAARRFHPRTVSAALGWDMQGPWRLSFALDHAERAPTAEELFSDGPHAATRAYEIGDPSLDLETAQRFEIGAHWHTDRIDLETAVYLTRFDDFIYLLDTGEEADDLPIRQWNQDDARFHGFEMEADVMLIDAAAGRWELGLMADRVHARLDDGSPLPRIPAARVGAELRWSWQNWRANLGARHHREQDRVSDFELPSDSYTLVHANLNYAFDWAGADWEAFLQGRNLGDQEARPHTSFLKDLAPLPGRQFTLGLRVLF